MLQLILHHSLSFLVANIVTRALRVDCEGRKLFPSRGLQFLASSMSLIDHIYFYFPIFGFTVSVANTAQTHGGRGGFPIGTGPVSTSRSSWRFDLWVRTSELFYLRMFNVLTKCTFSRKCTQHGRYLPTAIQLVESRSCGLPKSTTNKQHRRADHPPPLPLGAISPGGLPGSG